MPKQPAECLSDQLQLADKLEGLATLFPLPVAYVYHDKIYRGIQSKDFHIRNEKRLTSAVCPSVVHYLFSIFYINLKIPVR